MGAVKRTSISAGMVIYRLLSRNEEISTTVTKIFPEGELTESKLPYIYFKRVKAGNKPVKTGDGAEYAYIEVACCAQDYDNALILAELVKADLDNRKARYSDINMRFCICEDSWDEPRTSDACEIKLLFKVGIG